LAKVATSGPMLMSPLSRFDCGNIKTLLRSHEPIGVAAVYACAATWRPPLKCCGAITGRWGAILLIGRAAVFVCGLATRGANTFTVQRTETKNYIGYWASTREATCQLASDAVNISPMIVLSYR